MAITTHRSSVIAATEYFPDARRLQIYFTNGEVYSFTQVPGLVYQEFLDADSKGIYFGTHIKEHYEFERVKRA